MNISNHCAQNKTPLSLRSKQDCDYQLMISDMPTGLRLSPFGQTVFLFGGFFSEHRDSALTGTLIDTQLEHYHHEIQIPALRAFP